MKEISCYLMETVDSAIVLRHSWTRDSQKTTISVTDQLIIEILPKKYQDADSVYLIRNGNAYIRSAAGIRCLLYMKWYYKMWFPLFWLIPLPIRDLGYRVIAKYRHKFFKRSNECLFRID